MLFANLQTVVQPSLLEGLLQQRMRFAVQPIEPFASPNLSRFEWFFRPQIRGLTTQQVFDRLGDDPDGWMLELQIVERGLRWSADRRSPVSLNLSPSAVSNRRCRQGLRELLVQYGSECPRAWWEITESWPMINPVEGRRTVDLLRAAGQLVAFDDVASRSRLSEWVSALGRPDVVKIDQSVIQRRPGALAEIVDAIHDIEAVAVVEGVESFAAYLEARRCGASHWQGYYLATPEYVLDEDER
jgi:EAL domain-containing protein (putative c-di-GMP-specific phosphodiesterase class I)